MSATGTLKPDAVRQNAATSGSTSASPSMTLHQHSWPFDSPPDVACITVRAVVDGVKPILMASRDADNGGWQFLTGEEANAAEAVLVSLKSMVDRDSTLLQLAGVQPGWIACRDRLGAPWTLHAEGGTKS